MVDLEKLKTECLEKVNETVHKEYEQPVLRQLFIELTSSCNLKCQHCGSSCGPRKQDGVPLEMLDIILSEIAYDPEYKENKPFIVLTGGEPMLRPDFVDVIHMIHDKGFNWGMTTNGTLMTKELAQKCREAGMYSVAISLDDLPEYHDAFRQVPGAYEKAVRGLETIIAEQACKNIVVTTVLTHQSISRLDAIFDVVNQFEIDAWRVVGIEPIGRALTHPEMLFTAEDYHTLFEFIRNKRMQNIPVEYSCPHYLGLDYERDLRNWFFKCIAGIEVASIMSNGDIGACLDIERTKQTIQGNVYRDDLLKVWRKGFAIYRQDLVPLTAGCAECSQAKFCRGGSHHTYNHAEHVQRLCMKGVLF